MCMVKTFPDEVAMTLSQLAMLCNWIVFCGWMMACEGSSFRGSASVASTNPASNQSGDVAVEAAEAVESEATECLLATGGDAKAVVSISQGNVDLSQITPNSVLLLQVQGQAQIDLSQAQIRSLKGICIFAAGGADIQLELNTSVLSMYYHSRGNSISKLNFGTSGSLSKLVTDVSGGSQLQLEGSALACDTLKLPYGGSSKITCNGAAL